MFKFNPIPELRFKFYPIGILGPGDLAWDNCPISENESEFCKTTKRKGQCVLGYQQIYDTWYYMGKPQLWRVAEKLKISVQLVQTAIEYIHKQQALDTMDLRAK
jgi:hypothetical protein